MNTLMSAPPTGRVGRYPKHTFQVKEPPFVAQPFFIAPVLPAETMESLFFEARVITDPIKNPIIGWKKQFYFFYVRITDLLNDTIRDMFVDPANVDLTATLGAGANNQTFYTAKGGIDYTGLALVRIVNTYFRDQDTTAAQFVYNASHYAVQHQQDSFLDSLTDKDELPEGAAIAGATDAGDLDRLMDAFNHLRAMGVANMTYEDFLRSYGLSIPKKDENKPELLASFSDFQYPSNTVDPATGAPSSAVSWVFKNGHRKPKLFKEPGFVVGISVTRPKIYLAGLAGSAVGFMGRAWDWMPNYMANMPETGLKNFAAGTGPLGDRTTDTDQYWLDMRDLLLHGDQFQNMLPFAAVPVANGNYNMVALPATGLLPTDNNWKYVPYADVQELFVTPATAFNVRSDGYVSLGIKGKQIDFTQGNFADI